jgi:hypothetical protein
LTTHHAFLTHQILEKLNLPKPVIMKSSEEHKALHLHLGSDSGLKETNGVFNILKNVCGELVRHRKLSETELTDRGYDPGFVKQANEKRYIYKKETTFLLGVGISTRWLYSSLCGQDAGGHGDYRGREGGRQSHAKEDIGRTCRMG